MKLLSLLLCLFVTACSTTSSITKFEKDPILYSSDLPKYNINIGNSIPFILILSEDIAFLKNTSSGNIIQRYKMERRHSEDHPTYILIPLNWNSDVLKIIIYSKDRLLMSTYKGTQPVLLTPYNEDTE